MSTEVSIYGLVTGNMIQFFPRIAAIHHEMGISGLRETLEYVSRDRPDLLEEHIDTEEIDGLVQYMVLSVENLLDHIEQHPYTWDSVGVGFKGGLELMLKRPGLRWWFHVCF